MANFYANPKLQRAVVSEVLGQFVVSVLVRIGVDTWRDSRTIKPRTFYNQNLAIEYARTFGDDFIA